MDTPTYRILWPAVTIALPGLQDFQVSVPTHIPAEFMQSSQLHVNNFDRRSRPLIDQQCLTWPAATMALPGLYRLPSKCFMYMVIYSRSQYAAWP